MNTSAKRLLLGWIGIGVSLGSELLSYGNYLLMLADKNGYFADRHAHAFHPLRIRAHVRKGGRVVAWFEMVDGDEAVTGPSQCVPVVS